MSWARFLVAASLLAGMPLGVDAQISPNDQIAWAAFTQKPAPPTTERYGSANALQELEIYPARSSAGSAGRATPVLMLVHGGGWGGGTRDALAAHARYFAALGWTSINLSYRLTSLPGVTLLNAQEDVRAAFDWIRIHASQRGWDATRIVVLGESAGGQLACAMGVLPPDAPRWQPHALVLINPVLDLTSLTWALNQPGLREAGPFNPAAADKHPAYAVSPLFHVTKNSPPTLLLHGRDDNVVPFAQAEAYAGRAKTVGAKLELVALEKTGHAFVLTEFGSPEVIRATLQRIAQFLDSP
ncbi:MAG: alpha/beta hydrolase [Opitutaceae bacterium]